MVATRTCKQQQSWSSKYGAIKGSLLDLQKALAGSDEDAQMSFQLFGNGKC
jgi:hypothetical protein